MVTIKDIAKESGFSVSVVSRALNPKPDQKVKATTEKAIKDIAEKLGYRPNHTAAFLQRGRNPSVGVFLPHERNSLMADMIFGISDAARKYGLVLNFYFGLKEQTFHDFLDFANKNRVAGILSYMPVYKPLQKFWQEKCQEFINNGGKAVFINNPGLPELNIPSVCIDNYTGGRTAAEYLIKKGCGKLICAEYTAGSWQLSKRTEGFKDFALSADLLQKTELFPREKINIALLDKYKRECDGPLGVFACTDYVVLDLVREYYLANRIYEIGKEVLLMGFDDLNESQLIAPAMTTFYQNFQKIGQIGMEKLSNIIINGKKEESVLIQPELIIRESA